MPGAAGFALVILSSTLPAACSPDSDSAAGDASATGVTTTVDTIDDVVHVLNNGTPPRWQLTQVASIGPKSLTGDGSPDEFGRVYDVSLPETT